VRKLLRSCLEKEPKKRLRDIGDAWRLIEEVGQSHPPANTRSVRPLRWMAASAVLALAAASLAFVHFRETSSPAPTVRFTISAPDKAVFARWMALSPDGRHLAFSATGQDGTSHIWIRSLDSLEARPVPGSDATVVNTFFWSADSRFLVFQAGAKLRKVDMTGGAPYSLCDSPATMLGGSWNSAGDVLFGSNSGPIARVPSAGGVSSPVTRVELSRSENYHSDPIFLPDGVHFLYFRHSSKPELQGLYVGSLESKPEAQSLKRIQPLELSFGFAPARNGSAAHLLVVREGSLFSLPFDVRRMETTGEPLPIAEQVGSSITRAFFSVSDNGMLVYRGGGAATDQMVWFDREGRVLGAAADAGEYQDLALSPDGTRLAYNRPTQGPIRQIWILDIARAVHNRLTFIPEGARAPVWSPDGRRLAFSGATTSDIYIQDVAAGGSAERVFQAAASNILSDWSRDGRFIVYTQTTNAFDVLALTNPLGGGERKALPVANSEFVELHGRVSPDGHWIAYDSAESGRYEIYVRPFPPGEGRTGKWQVSSNGGQQPRWRGDGGELYYLGLDRMLTAVEVKTGASFQSGTPHALFNAPANSAQSLSSSYDVTQDGRQFIAITAGSATAAAPATVVLNWDAALKR
jgi:Tol biopolymer transport system component